MIELRVFDFHHQNLYYRTFICMWSHENVLFSHASVSRSLIPVRTISNHRTYSLLPDYPRTSGLLRIKYWAELKKIVFFGNMGLNFSCYAWDKAEQLLLHTYTYASLLSIVTFEFIDKFTNIVVSYGWNEALFSYTYAVRKITY